MVLDCIFEEEQQHLEATYQKLLQIRAEVEALLQDSLATALEDKKLLFDEMTRDFSADVMLESLTELEATNRIIEAYNLSADINAEKLRRVAMLLDRPYFAKISMVMEASGARKDIYIGTAGMTDDMRKHFIVDWRSPVAEVYYNQGNGPMTYDANGRTIAVDLKQRRQFDIERNKLKAYFDTTVAIEDALLLAALARGGNPKLSAITTTIQKEQNTVIRHPDCPVLLVQGIAGSGKTSVLLQRIAYLFYRERDTLKPEDVYLITPNGVFERYIDAVLPDMGESNPNILTWDKLMESLGLAGRGISKNTTLDSFTPIDQGIHNFRLQPEDICDITIGTEKVVPAASVRASLKAFKSIPLGTHLTSLVIEDLLDKLKQRIARLSKDEDTQEQLFDLTVEEQLEIFGTTIFPLGDEELPERTAQWLEWRYRDIPAQIEDGAWLRIDRIGMRLLGVETLDTSQWLYLKLALVGGAFRKARYVMVDEVQDYTAAQLAVLGRLFPNARFMLLGDENQAIHKGCASFSETRDLFNSLGREVSQCQLMISYRSTPEITAMFCGLLPESQRGVPQSVRPGGRAPVVQAWGAQDYAAKLADLVAQFARCAVDAAGATLAVVAKNPQRAKEIYELLGGGDGDAGELTLLEKDGLLPKSGIVVLDVALAKGLEFHSVIVADASEKNYPADQLHRCRLYTAMSRATEALAVVASGEITPLLKDYLNRE